MVVIRAQGEKSVRPVREEERRRASVPLRDMLDIRPHVPTLLHLL